MMRCVRGLEGRRSRKVGQIRGSWEGDTITEHLHRFENWLSTTLHVVRLAEAFFTADCKMKKVLLTLAVLGGRSPRRRRA